jgi:hypothetical protein
LVSRGWTDVPAERHDRASRVGPLGYAMVPIGLLFSVLGYRLNDVDAAIGRSAAYAAVTMLVGVVWAVGVEQQGDRAVRQG